MKHDQVSKIKGLVSRCLGKDLADFNRLGNFIEDDPPTVAATLLQEKIFSKFESASNPLWEQEAKEKFLSENDSIRAPVIENSGDELLFGEMRSIIYDFFYPEGQCLLDWHNIFLNADQGPGVAVGEPRTNYYFKLFDGALSTTSPKLYSLYKAFASMDATHAKAEENRYAKHGPASIVSGSQMYFVPKKEGELRTIAGEPVLDLHFQKGIGFIVTQRLKSYFGIDLRNQADINRSLAHFGSIVDCFSTIDLVSASNSVGVPLMDNLMPQEIIPFFKECRSPVTRLPSGELVELKIWSTMGNGYTFPLQTLIFSAAVKACLKVSNLYLRANAPFTIWTVFGDDIIVPKVITERLLLLLGKMGFSVNNGKTFISGYFKESCGRDFLRGYNVRPVYLKRFNQPEDFYIAINLLNAWSARTGLHIPRTIQYLMSQVKVSYVPLYENIDAGIRIPFSLTKAIRDPNGSMLYTARQVVAAREKISQYEDLNIEGLIKAVLRGGIASDRHHDGYFLTRMKKLVKRRYRTVRRVTPNWDVLQLDDTLQLSQWNSAVLANFTN